jgi:hypothetical protein
MIGDVAAGQTWRLVLPASGLGPVDQDPDQVRTDACDLLSPSSVCHPPDPDFQVPDAPSGGGLGLGPVAWVFLILAVAVLVGLIVRALARRVGDRDDDSDDAPVHQIVPLAAAAIDTEHPPSEWRERSRRHRAVGEHRQALRCEYRALVGDLARRHLLDEIPGRTSGEERAQLHRTTPAVDASFGAAADMFDTVWFGAADATAEMLARFDTLEADVLAATADVRRPVAAG